MFDIVIDTDTALYFHKFKGTVQLLTLWSNEPSRSNVSTTTPNFTSFLHWPSTFSLHHYFHQMHLATVLLSSDLFWQHSRANTTSMQLHKDAKRMYKTQVKGKLILMYTALMIKTEADLFHQMHETCD